MNPKRTNTPPPPLITALFPKKVNPNPKIPLIPQEDLHSK